jgi:hypothetical protein
MSASDPKRTCNELLLDHIVGKGEWLAEIAQAIAH